MNTKHPQHSAKNVIIIPTLREQENLTLLIPQLLSYLESITFTIVVVDDDSNDGTREYVSSLNEQQAPVILIERKIKDGLGGALKTGIKWAYDNGAERIVTMDADLTHSPKEAIELLKTATGDITTTSRFLDTKNDQRSSFRKALSQLSRSLRQRCMGIDKDAGNNLRHYEIKNIPETFFSLCSANGNEFLIEVVFLATQFGFTLNEIPCTLSERHKGESKLSFKHFINALLLNLNILLLRLFARDRIALLKQRISTPRVHSSEWDSYWGLPRSFKETFYYLGAKCYRNLLIKPIFTATMRSFFPSNSKLLHCGCGSGEVDKGLKGIFDITALDTSEFALSLYEQNNLPKTPPVFGSALALPFNNESFDGVYSLGLYEHFSSDEIHTMLSESHRILKNNGLVVIFWPTTKSFSVYLLKCIHSVLKLFTHKGNVVSLHPAEPSLLSGKQTAINHLLAAGFEPIYYYFGIRDLFTQAIVIGKKTLPPA